VIEALEPLGGRRKIGTPFADAQAGEKNSRQEQQELELRARVAHHAKPATSFRASLESQSRYIWVYPLGFTDGGISFGCATGSGAAAGCWTSAAQLGHADKWMLDIAAEQKRQSVGIDPPHERPDVERRSRGGN